MQELFISVCPCMHAWHGRRNLCQCFHLPYANTGCATDERGPLSPVEADNISVALSTHLANGADPFFAESLCCLCCCCCCRCWLEPHSCQSSEGRGSVSKMSVGNSQLLLAVASAAASDKTMHHAININGYCCAWRGRAQADE